MRGLNANGIVLGLAAALAACAAAPIPKPSPAGDVQYHLLDDAGTAHYQLALGEVASGATPLRRELPAYPPDQLARCLPQTDIRVQVIVDTLGAVSEVRAMPAAGDRAEPAFFAAVQAAVMHWRFTPLRIDHWAADAAGNTHRVDGASRPFTLAYRFRFECHAGTPSVSASTPPQAAAG